MPGEGATPEQVAAWRKTVGAPEKPEGYRGDAKTLLKDPAKFYKPKSRPSGHDIGDGFGKDNGGAIPPNLISLPNTESNGFYDSSCKLVDAERHPARFPAGLPEFFVKFLTSPGDVVLDIFGGSNVTGQVAEGLGRRWLSFEMDRNYVAASAFRFMSKDTRPEMVRATHRRILDGECVDIVDTRPQPSMLDLKAAE